MIPSVGVSEGQCGPESIYLHMSTGRGRAESHILATVNGPLMDAHRQVLLLEPEK